jgi:DNA-binding HxlR family transcriptional regulator
MSDPAGALADALDLVGDRWSLQLVATLVDGPKRFNELQSDLSVIAPNVLTARLRQLEAAGLLVGRPYSERPVRLQYELTEDGHALRDVVDALVSWEQRRRGVVPTVHALCGTPLRFRLVCPTCRVIIDSADGTGGPGDSVLV